VTYMKDLLFQAHHKIASQKGFSTVEVVLSIGIGAALLAGGLYVVSDAGFYRTDSAHSKRKFMQKTIREKRAKLSRHPYAKKFTEVINRSGISRSYFKMPVSFRGLSDHCGKKQTSAQPNGCFMKLSFHSSNDAKQGQPKFEGIQAQDILLKTTIKGKGKVASINFFRDEATTIKTEDNGTPIAAAIEKKLFPSNSEGGSFSLNILPSLDYKTKVYQSRDSRYFVGYRLTGDDIDKNKAKTNEAFYIMTHAEDSFYFEIDSYRGTTKDMITERVGQCNNRNEAATKKFLEKVDQKLLVFVPKKFNNEKMLEKYKDQFYLFFYPNNPMLYYIGYIKKFNKCTNSSINWSNPENMPCRQLNMIVGLSQPTIANPTVTEQCNATEDDYEDQLHVDIANIEEIYGKIYTFFGNNFDAPNKRLYQRFGFQLYGSEHTNTEDKNNYQANKQKGILKNGTSVEGWNPPFFPYKKPTLRHPTIRSPRINNYEKAVNAHYLINHFSSTPDENNGFSPASRLVAVPVDFHKFYISKSNANQKTNSLFHAVYDGSKSGLSSESRPILKGLNKDSHVVFARQLGKNRFTTFVVLKETFQNTNTPVVPADNPVDN